MRGYSIGYYDKTRPVEQADAYNSSPDVMLKMGSGSTEVLIAESNGAGMGEVSNIYVGNPRDGWTLFYGGAANIGQIIPESWTDGLLVAQMYGFDTENNYVGFRLIKTPEFTRVEPNTLLWSFWNSYALLDESAVLFYPPYDWPDDGVSIKRYDVATGALDENFLTFPAGDSIIDVVCATPTGNLIWGNGFKSGYPNFAWKIHNGVFSKPMADVGASHVRSGTESGHALLTTYGTDNDLRQGFPDGSVVPVTYNTSYNYTYRYQDFGSVTGWFLVFDSTINLDGTLVVLARAVPGDVEEIISWPLPAGYFSDYLLMSGDGSTVWGTLWDLATYSNGHVFVMDVATGEVDFSPALPEQYALSVSYDGSICRVQWGYYDHYIFFRDEEYPYPNNWLAPAASFSFIGTGPLPPEWVDEDALVPDEPAIEMTAAGAIYPGAYHRGKYVVNTTAMESDTYFVEIDFVLSSSGAYPSIWFNTPFPVVSPVDQGIWGSQFTASAYFMLDGSGLDGNAPVNTYWRDFPELLPENVTHTGRIEVIGEIVYVYLNGVMQYGMATHEPFSARHVGFGVTPGCAISALRYGYAETDPVVVPQPDFWTGFDGSVELDLDISPPPAPLGFADRVLALSPVLYIDYDDFAPEPGQGGRQFFTPVVNQFENGINQPYYYYNDIDLTTVRTEGPVNGAVTDPTGWWAGAWVETATQAPVNSPKLLKNGCTTVVVANPSSNPDGSAGYTNIYFEVYTWWPYGTVLPDLYTPRVQYVSVDIADSNTANSDQATITLRYYAPTAAVYPDPGAIDGGASYVSPMATRSFLDGEYHVYALTAEPLAGNTGYELVLYVDGAEILRQSLIGTSPFQINEAEYTDAYFDCNSGSGSIDEYIVYDRVLTPAEIATLTL